MKVLFLTSGDRVPSTRFRVLPFLDGLHEAGVEGTVAHGFPHKYEFIRWIGFRPSQFLKRLTRFWHLFKARSNRFDAIYIDRELFDLPTWDFENRFRQIARHIVLDLDDAVFLRYPEKIRSLVEMSDQVICGNAWIAGEIEQWNDRITVIPTGVRLASFPEKDEVVDSSRPIVGWMGTSANLEYFKVIAPALRTLAKKCAFELRLIVPDLDSLRGIDLSGVEIKHIKWNGLTEVSELRKIDIGVMPLFDDREWDKYKCPTKLIQYMAIGVPGVASPVGFTGDVLTHGVDGFLARTTEDWGEMLNALIVDPELRRRVGKAGRETVANGYCVEANLPKLIRVFSNASNA